MKEYFVTLFNKVYLPQGLSLCESLNKVYSEFTLFIFCIELLKVHTGVFNLGILVRHRILIYLMFVFIFMSQSKFNQDIKNY